MNHGLCAKSIQKIYIKRARFEVELFLSFRLMCACFMIVGLVELVRGCLNESG